MTGELDRGTSPQLELTLREAQAHARLVVVDLRELAFIDCAGMRTIVDADGRARRQGGQLTVVPGARRVDKVFTMTGTCDVLEIVDLDPAERPARALIK